MLLQTAQAVWLHNDLSWHVRLLRLVDLKDWHDNGSHGVFPYNCVVLWNGTYMITVIIIICIGVPDSDYLRPYAMKVLKKFLPAIVEASVGWCLRFTYWCRSNVVSVRSYEVGCMHRVAVGRHVRQFHEGLMSCREMLEHFPSARSGHRLHAIPPPSRYVSLCRVM